MVEVSESKSVKITILFRTDNIHYFKYPSNVVIDAQLPPPRRLCSIFAAICLSVRKIPEIVMNV